MSSFPFSDPVIVIGFCRSGTTLVAEMVHQGGTPMCTPEEEAAAARYDDGEKYERALAQQINTEILGLKKRPPTISSSWTLPQKPLTEEQLQRVYEQVGDKPWGFKEPLTTITYPTWAAAFQRGARIYTYRSHEEILRHYFRTAKSKFRALQRARRALRAWVHYNEQVLENLQLDRESNRPAALVRYEELMQDNDLIEQLQNVSGVALLDARNPKLRRSKGAAQGGFETFAYGFACRGYQSRLNSLYEQLGAARLTPNS